MRKYCRQEIKMLAIEGFIRNTVVIFLGVVVFDCFNVHARDCYEAGNKMVCYFQPNERYTTATWEDAWKVCNKNNSTLPVIENRLIEETLKKHRESGRASQSSDLWLAGREIRSDVRQWLNGKPFGLQNSFINPEKLINPYENNAVITGGLQYRLSYGRDSKNYICHCDDRTLCQNKSAISWRNGCLFVNDDDGLNFVDARNRCLDKKCDLATFEEDENLNLLKQRKDSLLDSSKEYWIGLRLNWWTWNDTDSAPEIKYSNWESYGNVPNQECLYIRFPSYKWNQASCQTGIPFICQTVTKKSNISTTDFIVSTTTRPGTQVPGRNNPDAVTGVSPIDLQTGIIIGAIAVIVVVIVIIAMVMILKRTKDRRNFHRTEEKPTIPHKMSTQSMQNMSTKDKPAEVDEMSSHMSVKDNPIEANEMSSHYAVIPRTVDQENNVESRDEAQPGVVYAMLEFDANNAIYAEPVDNSQRRQEAGAPTKVGATKGNGQPGIHAESPTQAVQGSTCIYANV